jgi:hypothetical protein
MKDKKHIKVRDLKPSKDAKGGRAVQSVSSQSIRGTQEHRAASHNRKTQHAIHRPR